MAGYTPPQPPAPYGLSGHAVAVTPSDTTTFTPPLRALWVGTTGNLAITLVGDTASVTLTGVPVGKLEIGIISKVNATGTTASGIIGFYG